MLKTAVIGLGYWGPNLVRNLSKTKGVEVKYLCDLSQANLDNWKSFHGATLTTDYRDILSDPSIDAVAIATPVSTHFRLASDALNAGKHVLLEKPMALNVNECAELIRIAEDKKLVLQVDHTYLYTGAVRRIKEIVSSGELGDVLYFDSVRVNLGLFQHDVNVVWDLAPHDLSIMDYVIPHRCIAVSGSGISNFGGDLENIAFATLYFDSGVIAHINVNWLSPVKIRRIIIGGTKKMIVFNDLEPSDKLKIYDKGVDLKNSDMDGIYSTLVKYRTGDMLAPNVDGTEALKYECNHFAECIRTGARPITDGEMGMRVVALIAAINESIANDGKKIEIGVAAI
ncbi:MAG: Gfo/Idh/MocA family oxidoreductase [Deltaproteobacteria bacterium]|mgnify:FL=1